MRMERWVYTLPLRLKSLFRRDRAESELAEELQDHVERTVEENIAHGLAPQEARRAALRALEGLEQRKEECRDARRVKWLEDLLQDLRYGLRTLRRNLGVTGFVVVTLALGIGATTAIFSVINSVLLRPLPYPESERLVLLTERNSRMRPVALAWPDFVDWRAQNHVFEHLGVFNYDSYNLTGQGDAERLLAGQVSHDLLAAMAVPPALGRVFREDDDRPGAAPVAVLNYALWQRRFGGDPRILDRTITLNDRSYAVIGVMPPGFQFPSQVDLWVPAGQLSGTEWQNRGNHPNLVAVGRLSPGVTVEQARSEMGAIARGLAQQYPDTNQGLGVALDPLLQTEVGDVGKALWVLLGAAALVLAMACANVANLQLVRATARQREMTIRAALGADRGRLARQLLAESMLLALLGGAAGLLLGYCLMKASLLLAAASLPRSSEVHLDGHVLVFALVLSLLTGVAFGLAPIWRLRTMSAADAGKESWQCLSGGKQHARSALVVSQMGLAMLLLTGAGLLLQSFYRLQRVDTGFAYDRIVTFSLMLPEKKYPSLKQRGLFFDNLLTRLNGLPGVQSAALTSGRPFGNSGWRMGFVVEGQPVPPERETPELEAYLVSPGYFRTLGIPLLAGRDFNEQDDRQHLANLDLSKMNDGARFVAGLNAIIIDEEFAHRYWPGEDAVGKHLRLAPVSPDSPLLTVVGVVGRTKMSRLNVESHLVQGYLCYRQAPLSNMTVLLKSAAGAGPLLVTARQQVQSLDSTQPIYSLRTLEELRSTSIAPQRLNLALLSLFAAFALALAAIGMYGLMSYVVTLRTHEIGIRLALGARPWNVVRLVTGQGLVLSLAGAAAGLAGAFALTRLMRALLFGVTPTDPVTFVCVPLGLMLVGLAACWLPAQRAARVDPMAALRYE